MQEVDVSKCIFKRGANTLTWKKSYMKSQTILIYKKIYLDLHQKAEVFIFHYFFSLISLNLAGSERIILITFFLVSWLMFFTPERLLEISVLELFLFAIM